MEEMDDPEWPTYYGATIGPFDESELVNHDGPDASGFDREAEKRLIATKFKFRYTLEELRYKHEIVQRFDETGALEFLNPKKEETGNKDELVVESTKEAVPLGLKRVRDIEPEPALGAASSSSDTRALVGDPLAESSEVHVLKRPRMDLPVSTEEPVIQNLKPGTDSSPEAVTGAVLPGSTAQVEEDEGNLR